MEKFETLFKIIFSFKFENCLGKIEIWQNLETGQNYFSVFYNKKYWKFLELEPEIGVLFQIDFLEN